VTLAVHRRSCSESAFATAQALDDPPHLQELGFRVLGVFGSGQRAFGAGAQLALEIADVGVGRRLRFERDVATGVVVDLGQRGVDARDALADRLAPHRQLGVEVGHLADGVLVEQFLEARFEARQVVGLQLVEHLAVLEDRFDAGVDFGGIELELLLVGDHRLDDPVAQQVELA
jgi:hypothetical protein